MLSDREFTRRMVRTVLTVALVAIAAATLWAARDAVMLIYISALIAMGFSPLVRIVERPDGANGHRLPRTAAILLVYLAIVAVVVAIGLTVVPPLIEQAGALWTRLPRTFNDFQSFLIRHHLTTHRVTLQEAVQNAPTGTGDNAMNAVNAVAGAVWRLIGGLFGVITILILSFYLLVEADRLVLYIARFVPESRRATLLTAFSAAVAKVSAWLRAQLILAGVMGGCAALGLGLMGVPYFFVVALVAAIGETIPIVGPIIGGITATGIALTVSPKLALAVGGYFLVLHQIEANLLVPKIMERRVGVSPVTVIVALLIGHAVWGIIGAILAIPTAAILSVFVEEFVALDLVATVDTERIR